MTRHQAAMAALSRVTSPRPLQSPQPRSSRLATVWQRVCAWVNDSRDINGEGSEGA